MRNFKRFILGLTAIVLLFVFSFNKKIVVASDFIPPGDGENFVVSERNQQIVPGVMEKEVVYNDSTGGKPVSGFLVDIDLNTDGVNIMASTTDYDKSGTQTVMEMAKASERATGRNIVAGINADLNWDGDGLSRGVTIVDGKSITDIPSTFFGIKYNGEAVIGSASVYSDIKDDLYQAVRGMGWLVRDNKPVATGTSLAPRTTVGIKEDGSVFFYVVEGRGYPRSIGIGTKELAEIMHSYGAVQALNLDGGGSTTYISKREGDTNLSVRNLLSDGRERASISSLFVYYDNEGDGEFNRARLSTEHNIYTPNSIVEVNAVGVDSAGFPVDLPEDLTWELEDDTFGSINSSGEFASDGKEGEVNVLLKQDGRVVGEYTFEIRSPEEIQFFQSEYNLGFDEKRDLGIRLLHNHNEIKYRSEDLVWKYNEEIGTIDENNILTSSSDGMFEGEVIRVEYVDGSVFAEATINMGMLPVVHYDFEEVDGSNDYWDEELNYKVVGNGAEVDLSIAKASEGDPVRYGEQSLRMDFDFTNVEAGSTVSVGIGPSENLETLPGAPTSVGVWVYGTEEAQGHWLRTQLYSGAGTSSQGVKYDDWKLDEEHDARVNWLGWRFLEIDLTDYDKPVALFNNQLFRVVLSPAKEEQLNKGSLYFDNLTFIYGHNPNDIEPPVFEDVKVNDELVEDGKVKVDTNRVNVEAVFYDYVNEYTSGINEESVTISVNGTDYREDEFFGIVKQEEDIVYLSNIILPDGIHKVDFTALDNEGNSKTETIVIEVDTNTPNKVYFSSDDIAVLGKAHDLNLYADLFENVDEVEFSLRINRDFENFEINTHEDFEYTYNYLDSIQILTVNIKRKSMSDENNTSNKIATITFDVNPNLSVNSRLDYSLISGSYKYIDNEGFEDYKLGFHLDNKRLELNAQLDIDYDLILVGHEGVFKIVDESGNPVEGAELFLLDGKDEVLLGISDVLGEVILTEFSEKTTQFDLVAVKDDLRSFVITGQSLDSQGEEDGTPFNVILNGEDQSHENKNISWFSNTQAENTEAIVKYALLDDYNTNGESAFEYVYGKNEIVSFIGYTNINDNFAININNVTINNLEDGKDYVYMVGNGDVWSEERYFSTMNKYADTNMLVLGDIIADSTSEFLDRLNHIANDGVNYDFILQTGDMIDEAHRYNHWNDALSALSSSDLAHLDLVNALGNNEFKGHTNAESAKVIYNIPEENDGMYYSIEYGIIYIAVLNFTRDEDIINDFLDWVVEDAKDSNALWKVMATHEPVYYSNPGGGNGVLHNLAPEAIEEAGFDFVFSGNDNVYARTKPLINGEVNNNGPVYIISGALGQKRYETINNPDFHFEAFETEFDAVYLSVEANDRRFEITARDIDGGIIDTYTKTKETSHEHNYILEGDRIVCYECNYSRELDGYIGFLKDNDGNKMFYLLNNFQKGIYFWEDNIYYFDDNGHALTGNSEVWGLEVVFDEEGRYVSGGTGFVEFDDKKHFYRNLQLVQYTGFTKIEEKYYYFSSVDFSVRKGLYRIDGITYLFDEETGEAYHGINYYNGIKFESNEKGEVLSGGSSFIIENGKIYYYKDFVMQKSGFTHVDGEIYYISSSTGEVITGEYRGNIYDNYGRLISGKWHYDENGIRYSLGGKHLSFEEKNYLTSFQEIDGDIYYFDEEGYLMIGTIDIDGFIIETDENGIIQF